MSRCVVVFSLLALTVAACSSGDSKRAVGGFKYAKTPEAKELVVPQGLDQPKEHRDFKVSNDINHNGPVGKNVDIRAPSLVLPVAASSRGIADSEDSIIWFDQVLEDRNLLEFIQLALKNELITADVELNLVDKDAKTYESGWFHEEVETGWIFKSIENAESMRFKYKLVEKPHGRSVSLQVNLIDYMKTDSRGGAKSINPIDQQRAEMAMINEIIAQVDFMYRLEQKEVRMMRANKQMVAIGENPEAEPAYIVEMDFDYLWSNLPIFFEKHGFVITDLNESDKIYYVNFTSPEIGIWDKIWGDEAPVVDISDAKYQFVLSKMVNQTSVTIYNADGDVLPIETLERIFPVMEPGLSFRNTY